MNGRIGLLSIITASLLYTIISGCSSTGKSAYNEAPNRLASTAPTAKQIEAPLNGHSTPQATPVPAARKSKNPLVDEAVTMSTTDLHGGAFPGLNDLPEKPISVETTETDKLRGDLAQEARKRQDLESQLEQNQGNLQSLESQLAQLQATATTTPEEQAQTVQLNATIDGLNNTITNLQNQLQVKLEEQSASELLEEMPSTPNFNGDLHNPDMFGTYRIGAGDILEFQSFNDETLSRELIVKYDGSISLPLIQDVNVLDLTREEAEQSIRDAYIRVFRDPQISLLVRETGSKTFTIVGDTQTPGIYPYTQATTLIQGISLAGGLRNRNSSSSVGGFVGITGQLTKAFIIRHTGGQRQVAQYDLRGLGNPGAHAADVPILPGDLIYLPEGVNLVYLLGESRNPIIVELTEGMSMLQLLSMSGGFNSSTAQLRNVVLMRQIDEDNTEIMSVNVRKILKTGHDVKLQPGDVIYLPQKKLVRLEEFVRRFTGSISPVLQLYTNALDTYYSKDLIDIALDQTPENATLNVLNQLEQFGTSTQNIVDLFGAP